MENRNRENDFKFWVCGAMIALTIISAVTAGFLTDYSMGGRISIWASLPGAVFAYILMISMDNIQSECFGFAFARRTTWICFASEAFMMVFFELLLLLPHPGFVDVAAYRMMMHSSMRAAVAGLVGFLFSSFINSYLINGLKLRMRRRYNSTSRLVWVRTWLSTAVAQLFDAAIFIFCTFAFVMPWKDILVMFIGQYTFKLVIALIWCAAETRVISFVKRKTGCDEVVEDSRELTIFG